MSKVLTVTDFVLTSAYDSTVKALRSLDGVEEYVDGTDLSDETLKAYAQPLARALNGAEHWMHSAHRDIWLALHHYVTDVSEERMLRDELLPIIVDAWDAIVAARSALNKDSLADFRTATLAMTTSLRDDSVKVDRLQARYRASTNHSLE